MATSTTAERLESETEEGSPSAQIFREMFGDSPNQLGGHAVQIPPNSIREFDGRFLAYESRKRLLQEFPAQEKHANPLGNLQGGVIAALVDDTMGPLSFAAARGPTTTLNMAVNYLRAVPCPATVRVEARVTGRGRQILFLEAQVTDARGRLVATATSSVLVLRGAPQP